MDVYSFVSQYRVKLWDALEGCAQTGTKKKLSKTENRNFSRLNWLLYMTNYSDLQLAVIFPKKIENDGSIDGLTEWQDGKRSISSSGKISFYRLFFFKNEYRIHPYWQSRKIIWPTHYKILTSEHGNGPSNGLRLVREAIFVNRSTTCPVF